MNAESGERAVGLPCEGGESLKLFATLRALGYDLVDAQHQFPEERRGWGIHPFSEFRVYVTRYHRRPHGGGVVSGQVARDATALPLCGVGIRVRRGPVLPLPGAQESGGWMSDHWRLALRYSAWLLGVAVLISVVLFFVYGGGHAWSFFYGAGAAVLSFVSTALTISLFAGRSMAAGVMIGAYLGLWPVVPMLVGFAGVYVAENVAATVRVARTRNQPSTKPKAQGSAREAAGRRVGN